MHAADRAELTEILTRIADVAPWLSDAQLQDLACQLAVEAAGNRQGRARAAIVATRQEQLARLAREAITMLPKLTGSLISTRPGIFVADNADGRVTLLLSGQPAGDGELPEPAAWPDHWPCCAKLDELGVQPKAAVGHGIGELAGLAWAGCIGPAEVSALSRLRAAALAASVTAAPGSLRSALDEYATFEFGPPRCRLVSGCTGTQLTDPDDIIKMLTAELLDARSAEPGAKLSVGRAVAGRDVPAAAAGGGGQVRRDRRDAAAADWPGPRPDSGDRSARVGRRLGRGPAAASPGGQH